MAQAMRKEDIMPKRLYVLLICIELDCMKDDLAWLNPMEHFLACRCCKH